jgi:hypothetical protein
MAVNINKTSIIAMKITFFSQWRQLLLLVGILVASLPVANLYAGTESGGGGTSVVFDGQRVAIDLLMMPDFISTNKSKEVDAFAMANDILMRWGLLETALESHILADASSTKTSSVDWQWVAQALPLAHRYYLSYDMRLKISDIKTVAYYTKFEGKSVIQISKPSFEELPLQSQIAIVIHETIRHRQIGWDKNNNAFNEKILQQAAAILTNCQPKNRLSMFINFLFSSQPELAEKNFGTFETATQKYCVRQEL